MKSASNEVKVKLCEFITDDDYNYISEDDDSDDADSNDDSEDSEDDSDDDDSEDSDGDDNDSNDEDDIWQDGCAGLSLQILLPSC